MGIPSKHRFKFNWIAGKLFLCTKFPIGGFLVSAIPALTRHNSLNLNLRYSEEWISLCPTKSGFSPFLQRAHLFIRPSWIFLCAFLTWGSVRKALQTRGKKQRFEQQGKEICPSAPIIILILLRGTQAAIPKLPPGWNNYSSLVCLPWDLEETSQTFNLSRAAFCCPPAAGLSGDTGRRGRGDKELQVLTRTIRRFGMMFMPLALQILQVWAWNPLESRRFEADNKWAWAGSEAACCSTQTARPQIILAVDKWQDKPCSVCPCS